MFCIIYICSYVRNVLSEKKRVRIRDKAANIHLSSSSRERHVNNFPQGPLHSKLQYQIY